MDSSGGALRGWVIGENREGQWSAFYAELPDLARYSREGNGLLILLDATEDGVRERAERFMAVFEETNDRATAEAAANALET